MYFLKQNPPTLPPNLNQTQIFTSHLHKRSRIFKPILFVLCPSEKGDIGSNHTLRHSAHYCNIYYHSWDFNHTCLHRLIEYHKVYYAGNSGIQSMSLMTKYNLEKRRGLFATWSACLSCANRAKSCKYRMAGFCVWIKAINSYCVLKAFLVIYKKFSGLKVSSLCTYEEINSRSSKWLLFNFACVIDFCLTGQLNKIIHVTWQIIIYCYLKHNVKECIK